MRYLYCPLNKKIAAKITPENQTNMSLITSKYGILGVFS